MNGRALGDRAIEVSPSSARVLERAAEILTPFPVKSSYTFLIISQVRTDPALETGLVLPVDSVTSNVVQHVSDALTPLHQLKAVNPRVQVSCTVIHPHYNPHQCHHTCRAVQVKQVKVPVPLPCQEVFPSALVIGNVVPKAVDIIISQKMCLVYVVEQVVLKLL